MPDSGFVSYEIAPILGFIGVSKLADAEADAIVGVSLYKPDIGSNDIVATCDEPLFNDKDVCPNEPATAFKAEPSPIYDLYCISKSGFPLA